MADNLIQYSFAAGELSPTLFGRVELAKYRVGAAQLKNFFVDYRGGASTRPGTKYVGECKYADKLTRLIRFQFSADINQNYALEFGDLYMRVIQNGAYVESSPGVPYELVTPYAEDDLFTLKFTQSNDTMTITHPEYAPRDLTRTDHDAWTLTEVSFGTEAVPPTITSLTYNGSNDNAKRYSYKVTTVNLDGDESKPSEAGEISAVNLDVNPGAIFINWTAAPDVDYYIVYKAASISLATAVPAGATHGYAGRTYGTTFTDANITADFTRTPPIYNNPFANSFVRQIEVTAGGTGYDAGTDISLTDANGSGFEGYLVIESGVIKAVVVTSGGEDYSSPTVVLSNAGSGSGATFSVELGEASGNYPSVSSYFQQRKVYAGSYNQPQTLWGSKPKRYENMDYSIPTVDNDSFEFTLDSNQVNTIKHLISMPGGLVILTAGGAWQLSGGQQGAPVTPTNATASPQAYNGCNDMPPIAINYDILYVQAKGSIVRALSYNFFANIYTGQDVSILSNHLFYGHDLIDWAWAEEPFKLLWAIRDDGLLLSFTYLKDQEVYAWARHTTRGLYKSVCTVQEGNDDAAYFVVRRYINGSWVQYVERMASREMNSVEDAWCVDCGLEYPLTYPAAGLSASAATGTVTFTADAAVFSSGDVGSIIRMGGGKARITGYTSSTVVTATIIDEITAVIAEDPSNTPLPAAEGEWSCTAPVTTVSGLDHLEGQTVAVLADGNVHPQVTVTGGEITLQQPATKIIVGLPYQALLRTLALDVGEPTIQGKKKKIVAATLKVHETRGLKWGPTLDALTEVKERSNQNYGQAIPLQTGDQSVTMHPSWNNYGQIYVVQDNPLPASVLAVIPEVVMET